MVGTLKEMLLRPIGDLGLESRPLINPHDLKEQGIYEETLIVFLSDNGAAANLRQSSHNYPLKGGKYADWEARDYQHARYVF